MMRYPIALLLVAILPAAAQNVSSGSLRILVVEGESAFNDINTKTGRNLVIEVRDERNQPVAGAQVAFQLPAEGPTGTYLDGQRMFNTTTDTVGRARTLGFKPNNAEGRFEIRINVSKEGRTGSTVTSQSNTLAGGPANVPSKSNKKMILLITLGGAAAGAGILLGTRGSGSTGPTVPPGATVSIGTISVGGPR